MKTSKELLKGMIRIPVAEPLHGFEQCGTFHIVYPPDGGIMTNEELEAEVERLHKEILVISEQLRVALEAKAKILKSLGAC